jgi:hypothetical protein
MGFCLKQWLPTTKHLREGQVISVPKIEVPRLIFVNTP